MNYQMIIPPLVGAVIGYITNDIAIKMLFHPIKPVYIGNLKLPFTPGLIPKERERIAGSIGRMVGENLLDSKTLEQVFLSDEIKGKLKNAVISFIAENRENDETVEKVLLKFMSCEDIDSLTDEIKANVINAVYNKLTGEEFKEKISENVSAKIKEKMSGMAFGLFAGMLDGGFADGIAKSITDAINKTIADNSKGMISDLLDSESDKLMNCKVCDIMTRIDDKTSFIADTVIRVYERIIKNSLEHILAEIDIAKIIEAKIESFDIVEFENMLIRLMKKELRAIVYLGALLGFVMGWINVIFIR